MKSTVHYVALAIFMVVFSCNQEVENKASAKDKPDSTIQKIIAGEEEKVPAAARIVKTESAGQDSISISVEKNLFGTFFGDRAEFFVVYEPENLIHGTKIRQVTFCYLDGELCRSKYVLENDISKELIQTYGTFKIRGYDIKDRKIIEQKLVMIDYGLGKELNRNLHNFELSWAVGEGLVKVRVNRRDPDQLFEYIEQQADYKMLFRSIEYGSLPQDVEG